MSQVHDISKPAAAAIVAVALLCMTAPALAQDTSFGVRVSGTWSALPQPQDPRGEPTLMSGTAFNGYGYAAGVWSGTTVASVDAGQIRIDASALYGYQQVSGFEARGNARREAVIKARVIRIPVLAVYESGLNGATARIGAGVEPLIGLWSGAEISVQNSDEAPEPLFTTPVTHLGLTALLGLDIEVSDSLGVPLELRLTYDPMVGNTTVDRFQDFQSSSNPGDYEAAFRWQMLLSTGVSFDI
jgi:hypothetical protein